MAVLWLEWLSLRLNMCGEISRMDVFTLITQMDHLPQKLHFNSIARWHKEWLELMQEERQMQRGNWGVRALPKDSQAQYTSQQNWPWSPNWCGSVWWALSCQFDSCSGHMPWLRARSPFGGMWEATDRFLLYIDVSLPLSPSFPLSLKINK